MTTTWADIQRTENDSYWAMSLSDYARLRRWDVEYAQQALADGRWDDLARIVASIKDIDEIMEEMRQEEVTYAKEYKEYYND